MGQRARGTSIDQRYVISNTQATKVLSNHISIPSSRAPQHMQSSIDQHLYHYQDTRLLRFEQKISSTLFFIWASKHIESSKYQRYIITKTQDYWGSNTQPPQNKENWRWVQLFQHQQNPLPRFNKQKTTPNKLLECSTAKVRSTTTTVLTIPSN